MDIYVGQQFGMRQIVSMNVDKSYWSTLGMKLPDRTDKYVLGKCLCCGAILPTLKKNLIDRPPKRCVFCSNIGNHSNIETLTNSWVIDKDVAICNVMFHDKVVSFYIDKDRYNDVKQYTWRISQKRRKYYVITGSCKKHTMKYLHQMIYGEVIDNGMEIDHIDGNSLNNRIANLRLVTRQQNIDNQKATRIDNAIGIRGVSYDKRDKLFHVDFYYHGSRYYLKPWKTVEEAVWCRKCLEDCFGITALASNPLFAQYDTLTEEQHENIHKYVLGKILGNER